MKLPALKIPGVIARPLTKAKVVISKHSPEICLVSGIVLIVGGTVYACMSSRKIDNVVEHHVNRLENMEDDLRYCEDQFHEEMQKTEENPSDQLAKVVEEYDAEHKDIQKAMGKQKLEMVWDIFKLYAPPVAMIGGGVTLVVVSHHIMASRNAAIMAMYNSLSSLFGEYRDRVRKDAGNDKDLEYLTGCKVEDGAIMVNSEEDMEKLANPILPDFQHSPFSRVFESTNTYWQKSAEYNMMFLLQKEQEFNWELHRKGVVFLNEVYDALGFPVTSAGALVGWVDDGKTKISFGLQDLRTEKAIDFVNGWENCVWLDFNLPEDPIVYNKIKESAPFRESGKR